MLKNLSVFSVFLVLSLLAIVGLRSDSVLAHYTLSPGDTNMPSNLLADLRECEHQNGGTRTPAFVNYVSSAANPSSESFSVAYGQTSIALRFHFAGAVCFSTSGVTDSRIRVNSSTVTLPNGNVTNGALSGIDGEVSALNGFDTTPATPGFMLHTWNDFTYTPPGGFISGGSYKIRVQSQSINRFTNGNFLCIAPPGAPAPNWNYAACPFDVREYTINVTVGPPPSQAIVEGRKFTSAGVENAEFSYTDRVSIDTNQDGVGEQGTPASAFRWEGITTSNPVGIHAQNSEPNGWKVIGSVFCDRNTPNGTAECDQMTANPMGWGGYRIGSDGGGHGIYQPVSGTGTKIRTMGPLVSGHTYKILWIYDRTANPTDLCLNIDGDQSEVPPGMTRDASGNCNTTVDLCFNIDGDQGTIPPGMTRDVDGNCNYPPPPDPPGICSGPALRDAPIDRSSVWSNSYTDNNPPENGSTAPPNDGPRDATTYRQITYEYSHTDVNTTAYDEWGQGAPVTYIESNSNPARINYTPYASDYPYDYHTGTVGYTVWYKEKIVDSTRSETANNNTYTYPAATPPATTPPPEDYTTYSYGTWNTSESNTYVGTNRSSSAAQTPPCYDRKFDLDPAAVSSQLNDEENPTSVTFTSNIKGGYLAANDYGIGLRTPSHVDNFEVNGVYFFENVSEVQITGDTPFTFGNQSASAGGSLSTYYIGFNNNYSASIAVSRPPLNYGDRVCYRVVLPDATGMMRQEGNMQGDPTSKQSAKICSDKVGDKPYFRVYGGDITSGGSFQNNSVCATPSSGSIFGHYRNGTGGAATGLAAIGLGEVNGVISASQRSTSPTLPNGLTFGNDGTSVPVNTGSNQFGGNYGNGYCAPDYYSVEQFSDGDPRKNMSPPSGVINFTAGPFADGGQTVYSSPGVTKEILSPPPISKRHTVFVNGNVIIRSNLRYETANWTSEKTIPYITVIAKGNIYIESGVTELNGLFIAQPGNGEPGRIYTCKDWIDFNRDATAVSNCRSQLKVNGAFVAQQVVLQRTLGTVSTANGQQEPKTSANIAEVFNFTPEFYIGQPVFKPKTTKYDSIKDLPPVL
jgi:hypothetical protein